VAIVRYWDMAGTEVRDTNDPDATSGTLMAKHRDGSFWTIDRATITASVSRRDAFIKQTADADRARFGSRVVQWLEEQAGIGGHDAMQSLVRLLAGHRVQSERATGDKMTRAEPHASQVQVGNVKLVKGAWNDAYRLQLTGFPFATHDDDVDSSSGAFNKCADESGAVVGVHSLRFR
jgi:predicted phage terminase large subunit-like protein